MWHKEGRSLCVGKCTTAFNSANRGEATQARSYDNFSETWDPREEVTAVHMRQKLLKGTQACMHALHHWGFPVSRPGGGEDDNHIIGDRSLESLGDTVKAVASVRAP
jgi:hypothetical protein